MSDVGYKDLKINSGSETEVPWSDDDNGRSNDRESREPVEDFMDECASENMAKESSSNSSTEKPTNCSYTPGPFLSDLTLPYDISKAYDVKYLASHVSFDDYDGELNWQQVNQKLNSCALPQIISQQPLQRTVLSSRRISLERGVNEDTDKVGGHVLLLPGDRAGEGGGKAVREDGKEVGEKFCGEGDINFGGDAHGDEVQIIDSSNSNEIQMLRKSVSVESGLESVNGSNVTEIEERNASEIATNQAMAMITRLQEEKASLHMEALLYLRMMEEQAEHDVEALEKANDLLAEKEKEIQDMEAELEFYRLNFPDEIKSENFHGAKTPCLESEDENYVVYLTTFAVLGEEALSNFSQWHFLQHA
ncbi:hypothetical protein FEM48_Zijuj09G0051900 [Ziziphus jujuba var. spinosa]|uniref:GTD-binding domain-containing protein n=1 Tax=Ziziphus jujuba var. spinosa TaxID=714518 RepID=A0A978UR28_ZIZJJ|nr:hypothetical protein FEM48_Zijuj09G0051900 [Ziziphus jujuba var. spinosa]